VLAFALSRILQNILYTQGNQQCPRDILPVIKGLRQTWAEDHVKHLVKQCIEVLTRDVQKSRTILQVTYQSRAVAWKQGVQAALQRAMRQPGVEIVAENGVTATSGIPNRRELLQEMVLNMQDDENAEEDDDVDLEISRVVSMRQEEILERRRCSPSGELISMLNLSSSYESVSQGKSYSDDLARITRVQAYPLLSE
jgi:hypothetical protein